MILGYWYRLYTQMTAPEKSLEVAIAKLGERYRSQHPFLGLKHFADFALLDRKVIIEVDGDSHTKLLQREKDLKHTIALKALGWEVVRMSNEAALNWPEEALKGALVDAEFYRLESDEGLRAALALLHQNHPELLLPKAKKPRRPKSPRAAASAKVAKKSGPRKSSPARA